MAKHKDQIADILYEDNHLIVVNKPCGIPVQPDESGDKSLLDYMKDYIKEEYKKPGEVYLGLIHRIDRPVSGVVVMAKTSKALSRMNEMFKKRDVEKTYWALTKSKPASDGETLTHYLIKNHEKNSSKAHNKEKQGTKKAILDYEFKGRLGEKFLLEVKLQTGRHHQIRVQLAKVGLNIIGDYRYGYKRPNKDRSICLHARRLSFIHPIKKELVDVIAKLPHTSFWQDFKEMEKADF